MSLTLKRSKLSRPAKIDNVYLLIQQAVAKGEYVPVLHAKQRLDERQVTLAEVEYVIQNGRREPKKDEFKIEYNCWNYAIKGKTIDKRHLRIAVTLDRLTRVLVITVIDLDI